MTVSAASDGGHAVDSKSVCVKWARLVAAPIVSKDEGTRREAVEGVKNLALQCSDPGAVEKLVKYFFAVLNGNAACCSQW